MENLGYVSVLIIALSLSADCLAVAISGSIALTTVSPTQILRTSLSFGLFQALMAWIGWFVGHTIVEVVSNYDHWLAFILLLIVGSRMIWESVKNKEKTHIDISKGYATNMAIHSRIKKVIMGDAVAQTMFPWSPPKVTVVRTNSDLSETHSSAKSIINPITKVKAPAMRKVMQNLFNLCISPPEASTFMLSQ